MTTYDDSSQPSSLIKDEKMETSKKQAYRDYRKAVAKAQKVYKEAIVLAEKVYEEATKQE